MPYCGHVASVMMPAVVVVLRAPISHGCPIIAIISHLLRQSKLPCGPRLDNLYSGGSHFSDCCVGAFAC